MALSSTTQAMMPATRQCRDVDAPEVVRRNRSSLGLPLALSDRVVAEVMPLNGNCAASSKSRLRRRLYAQTTMPTKTTNASTVTHARRSSMLHLRCSLHVLQGGAEHLQIGDQRVALGLAFERVLARGDVGVGVRHAEACAARASSLRCRWRRATSCRATGRPACSTRAPRGAGCRDAARCHSSL